MSHSPVQTMIRELSDNEALRAEIARLERQLAAQAQREEELYERERLVAERSAELEQAVEALLVREQDIRGLNEDLEERVQQRTLALELANKELESFSYSVSHDLRAPLRAIDGFCRALGEDYGAQLDAQGQQYLQRVSAAALRMSQLIDDLLSLSRVARSELRSEAVDLSHMVSSIVSELQRGDALRQVAFVIAPDVQASGDAYLLRIALENLLANAWKFTAREEAPRIEFGQLPAPNETICYVRDNGAGFDMAYSAKLFGPFQRLHAVHDFPGTGIGLATVKRIMHRHGGRVWAEGQVGQGATFYFALPG